MPLSPFCHYTIQSWCPAFTWPAKTADTMEAMKKPWVYKRKGIKGWWCGWYEGGKRKAKAFPTKGLAEHFRHIKYTQLNSDVFTSVVDFDWDHMVEEYRQSKQVEGLVDGSIYEILLTLRHFKRIVSLSSSKEITQPNLDAFVLKRSEEVGKNTLNKDIGTCMPSSTGR